MPNDSAVRKVLGPKFSDAKSVFGVLVVCPFVYLSVLVPRYVTAGIIRLDEWLIIAVLAVEP